MTVSKQHLILAGGGHTHLYTFSHLDRFVRAGLNVTVISPVPFWYSGMGPGMLGERYRPSQTTVDIETITASRGGRCITERIDSIDPANRFVTTQSGLRLHYDLLSINIGSEVNTLLGADRHPCLFRVKPIQCLDKLRQELLQRRNDSAPIRLAVIGGGPAGVEVACNVHALRSKHDLRIDATLFSGPHGLLPDMPSRAAARMQHWFDEHDVAVVTQHLVREITPRHLVLDDNSRSAADIVILATGIHPPRLLKDTPIATAEDGALRVDRFLRSVSHPEIFGGGDCIAFDNRPLPRIGVHAVHEAPVLTHNLLATLQNGALRPYNPQKKYMLILNRGDGTGLFVRDRIVIAGRIMFRLKHLLDSRFIRKYQRK